MARTQTFSNGELGLSIRTKLNSIADWNLLYSYNIYDITHFNGVIYASAVDSNLGNNPTGSSSQWINLSVSASYASASISASYALQATSASWAPYIDTVGTTLYTGSTYEITASRAVSASWAPFTDTGTTLYTGSTYEITASRAVSASWVANLYPQTEQVSASWASSSISASWAPYIDTVGTTLYTGSTYDITASWANNAIRADSTPYATLAGDVTSGSWSSASLSSSWTPNLYPQVEQPSSSWASQSLSASWAPYIDTTGTTLYTGSTYEITSSWATNAVRADSTPYASLAGDVTSGSWASQSLSASWAPFVDTGTTLYTGSTYEITASRALVSVTSSYAVTLRVLNGATIGGMSEGVTSTNTVQIGSGDAPPTTDRKTDGAVQVGWGAGNFSDTASNAVQIGIQAGLFSKIANSAIQIGALAGGTATTASNAVQIGTSAGRFSEDSTNAVQIGNSAGTNATTAVEAVHIGVSAGSQAKTGSFTTFIGSNADALANALNVQKSIAIGYNAKVSASNTCVIGGTGADAVNVAIGKTSAAATLDVNGNISASSVTASLFGTASWATNAINGGTQLVTASTYPITASWSENSVSASWAPLISTSSAFTILQTSASILAISVNDFSEGAERGRIVFSGPLDGANPNWQKPTATIIGKRDLSAGTSYGGSLIFNIESLGGSWRDRMVFDYLGIITASARLVVYGNQETESTASVIQAGQEIPVYLGTTTRTSAVGFNTKQASVDGPWVYGAGSVNEYAALIQLKGSRLGFDITGVTGSEGTNAAVGVAGTSAMELTISGSAPRLAFPAGSVIYMVGAGTGVPVMNTGNIQYAYEDLTPFNISASWASVAISSSWTNQSLSASLASNANSATTATTALTASSIASSLPYITVVTSSTNWITCSFTDQTEYVNLATASVTYAFTSSNHPIAGQFSDLSIFLNNTMVQTASLSFPAQWTNMNGGWPTSITASKYAWVFLRAYGPSQVVGTYLIQS